jgi:ABC-type transporter Mla MlaB component
MHKAQRRMRSDRKLIELRMLKISEIKSTNHARTLRFEGQLVGPWVDEARGTCEQLLKERQSLRVELGDVDYLDKSGAALLLDLRSRGVSLVECSVFIEQQLKAAS